MRAPDLKHHESTSACSNYPPSKGASVIHNVSLIYFSSVGWFALKWTQMRHKFF